jgi:hypothetical protein
MENNSRTAYLTLNGELGTSALTRPTSLFRPQIDLSASRNIALSDMGHVLVNTGASAIVLTLPLNDTFGDSVEFEVLRAATGTLSLDPAAGVTINGLATPKDTDDQYDRLLVRKTATNTWVANEISKSDATLQSAYSDGNGIIITSAAKPVVIDTTLAGFQISGLTATSLVTSDASNNLVSGDLTGDVTTSAGLATTLATVATGATVGDATNIPQFTFNDKGLVTSATEIAVDFSSVDLQQAYDNSATPAQIVLAGGKPIQVRNAADDAGWEVDTNADRSFQTFTSSNGFPNFIKSEQTVTPTLPGATMLQIDNEGKNTVGTVSNYACFLTLQSNVTPGQEAGEARFQVLDDNVGTIYFSLDGDSRSVKSLNYTSKALDFTATLDDITLQNAYDTSLPTPTIVQNDVNHTRIENSFNTCGVEFETNIGSTILQIFGEQTNNMQLDFHNTDGFLGSSVFGKITGTSAVSGASYDIEWNVTDATAAAEDVDVIFRSTNNGSNSSYMHYIASTDTLQVLNNTSKTLDTVATLNDITLQNAYANGDGTITVDTAKPFEIIGEDSADPGKVSLYTPINSMGDTIAFLDFDGNNSTGSRVSYGEIDITISDPQAGDHTGNMDFKVSIDDSLQTVLTLHGDTGNVEVKKALDVTGANITFDARDVDAGYTPGVNVIASSNGAISLNSPLKASATSTFRVEQLTPSDPDGTPIIGYSLNSTAGVDEDVTVRDGRISIFTTDGATTLSAGDPVKHSSITAGRVELADSFSEAFAIAAESATTNDSVGCWIPVGHNDSLQSAYNNGDGKITTAASKKIEVVGIDNTDPSGMDFYTPSNTGVCQDFTFYGQDSVAAKQEYGCITTNIETNTAGSEDGSMDLCVVESGTPTTYLTLDGVNQEVCVTNNIKAPLINGIQPSGGVFLQTADGTTYTNSTTETSILGTGVGTLTVPGNTFVVSGYKLDVAGGISAQAGTQVTVRLVSNFTGTPVSLASVVVDLEATTSTSFELEADFVIRSIGAATVAEITTNMDFTYNRNAGNEFVGQRSVTSNSTTFDTTISNTLFLTAQFDTETTSNSIQTKVGTLTRTY